MRSTGSTFSQVLFQLLFTIVLYSLIILVMGLAIFPALSLCFHIWMQTAGASLLFRVLLLSLGIASGYFLYGFSVMLITIALRIILRLNLKEAEYHIVSAGALKWAVTNALFQLVAVTFMDFILLTPFVTFFYRAMGARIGNNVQINSKFCADVSLLEIGDRSVIGGHATVIGHSFERNRLILKKVKIGRKVIIGLNSIVLPGCEIGDSAIVPAGAVLGKNTRVESRTIYTGGHIVPHRDKREDNKEA